MKVDKIKSRQFYNDKMVLIDGNELHGNVFKIPLSKLMFIFVRAKSIHDPYSNLQLGPPLTLGSL